MAAPPGLATYSPQSVACIQRTGFRLLLCGPTSFPYSYAVDSWSNFTSWAPLTTNQFTTNQSVEIRDHYATIFTSPVL
jgi:hypothetical protein